MLLSLNPPLNPTLVCDQKGLDEVAEFLANTPVFGIDTETNVVKRFYDRRIRTIQVGTRDKQYVIDLLAFEPDLANSQGHWTPSDSLKCVADALRPTLDSGDHLKVGHNLSFDYVALAWCLGVQMWNLYDTMLAEKVLMAGKVSYTARGFWGLDHLAKRYGNLDMADLSTGFDLATPLTPDQLYYAALDARVVVSIRQRQVKVLQQLDLELATKIDCDAIPVFGDAHIHGFHLDREKWREQGDKTRDALPKALKELDDYFIPLVGRKHDCSTAHLAELEAEWRNTKEPEARALCRKRYQSAAAVVRERKKAYLTYQGAAAINYGSNPQVLAALQKYGLNIKSTSTKALMRFQNVGIVAAILKFRKMKKIISTYGEKFLDQYVYPEDECVHSDININGAATGRTSSSNPNMQNIPKGSEWRACFKALPGFKIVTLDYNGQELRILTELSKEIAWIKAFNNNWDLHSYCAELLDSKAWNSAAEPGCEYMETHEKCHCKAHKLRRTHCKSTNFAIPYGMGEKSLAERLEISIEDAKNLLERYATLFPGLIQALNDMASHAIRTGECRTLSNRRRLFNPISTERVYAKANEFFRQLPVEKQPKDKAKKAFLMRQLQDRAKNMLIGSIKREGKNTPIQGTGADMMKRALGCGFDAEGKPYLWHILRRSQAWLVNCVHDEAVLCAADCVADAILAAAKDAMIRAGSEFIHVVPVLVDGDIADFWKKD